MLDDHDAARIRAHIETAERYFRVLERPRALFDKPFVPRGDAPFTLARLSGLFHHLRLGPNLVVLDFGAGMCWLAGVLARTGCRVIALDVAATALGLGREALAALLSRPLSHPVEFKVFDGFTFDFADQSIDRIACFDALHHVPNKSRVLAEMFRVLRPGGLVCFAEPGPGHADSDESVRERGLYGVLEDEVAPMALCRMARGIGFAESYLVPVGEPGAVRWPADGEDPPGGRFPDMTSPVREVLIVLGKGPGEFDSRAPSRLEARVEIVRSCPRVEPGAEFDVRVRVTNTGDTRWLAEPPAHLLQEQDTTGSEPAGPGGLDYPAAFLRKRIVAGEPVSEDGVERYRRYLEGQHREGTVTVGARLVALDGTVIDRDYARGFFSRDVLPGEHADVDVRMAAPLTAGVYGLEFDPVDEYIAWFSDLGSRAARDYLRVGGPALAADSRNPGRLAYHTELAEPVTRRRATIDVTNAGDTIWLAGPFSGAGEVLLGLQSLDATGALVNRDWRRVPLPRCVAPGETIRLVIDLEHERAAGIRAVRLDLVAEGVTWFEQCGNRPVIVDIPPE
jgi:SAM-dependent methyltransferase